MDYRGVGNNSRGVSPCSTIFIHLYNPRTRVILRLRLLLWWSAYIFNGVSVASRQPWLARPRGAPPSTMRSVCSRLWCFGTKRDRDATAAAFPCASSTVAYAWFCHRTSGKYVRRIPKSPVDFFRRGLFSPLFHGPVVIALCVSRKLFFFRLPHSSLSPPTNRHHLTRAIQTGFPVYAFVRCSIHCRYICFTFENERQ